jgi:geranylgeranyl diphosphate synthase type II
VTSDLGAYLEECRALVLQEIQSIVPQSRYRAILYDYMLEYPLRLGKGFRPSLCIATCRACGGRLQDVLHTSAALELFHNAFLIHDDVEDGSHSRRGGPTLHSKYGVPTAVNVADGMFALCLQPLLSNTERIGLAKSLHVLKLIARMARETVEGQALELDWVRRGTLELRDRDYFLMTYKKTCWYTFITPCQVGGVIAGLEERQLATMRRFGRYIGVAFQIQDDVLNLIAEQERYGKEIGGDFWEGKRTLMVIHMLRACTTDERERAGAILTRAREDKVPAEIAYLYELVGKYGSVDYARSVARLLAGKARAILAPTEAWMPPSVHRDFLVGMTDYVISRDW